MMMIPNLLGIHNIMALQEKKHVLNIMAQVAISFIRDIACRWVCTTSSSPAMARSSGAELSRPTTRK
jgi:hypothetical protein